MKEKEDFLESLKTRAKESYPNSQLEQNAFINGFILSSKIISQSITKEITAHLEEISNGFKTEF